MERREARVRRVGPARDGAAGDEAQAGARGLRAVMEELMMEIMYEAPGNPKLKDIRITAEMVKALFEGGEPVMRLLA
jgi:ATP-dependent protease Clp ATPase subunit